MEAWNEQFTLYAAVAAEKLGGDPAVAAYINDRKAFVADLATRDYYRSDEVLFPPSDWEKGFNSTVCNGTKCQPGLFPWIAAWSQNITAQLLQVGSGPYLTSVSSTSDDIVFASAANITAVIDVAKAGDAPTATALVSYDAGKTFEEHPMSVTQVADHTYTAVASVAAISTTCTDGTEYGLGVYAPYRIQVTAATNTTLFPAEPRYVVDLWGWDLITPVIVVFARELRGLVCRAFSPPTLVVSPPLSPFSQLLLLLLLDWQDGHAPVCGGDGCASPGVPGRPARRRQR